MLFLQGPLPELVSSNKFFSTALPIRGPRPIAPHRIKPPPSRFCRLPLAEARLIGKPVKSIREDGFVILKSSGEIEGKAIYAEDLCQQILIRQVATDVAEINS